MADLNETAARLLALRKKMHLQRCLSRRETWGLLDLIEAQAREIAALTARAEAAEAKVANVRKAVAEYHLALDRREHGGGAAHICLTKVEVALEMPWVQGAALREIGGL